MPQRETVLMTLAKQKLVAKGRMCRWEDYSIDGDRLGEVRPGTHTGTA